MLPRLLGDGSNPVTRKTVLITQQVYSFTFMGLQPGSQITHSCEIQ